MAVDRGKPVLTRRLMLLACFTSVLLVIALYSSYVSPLSITDHQGRNEEHPATSKGHEATGQVVADTTKSLATTQGTGEQQQVSTDPTASAGEGSSLDQQRSSSFRVGKISENGQSYLLVITNTTPNEVTYPAFEVDAGGKMVLPRQITHVIVEVGTNEEPEATAIVLNDKSALLLAFEPQPAVFASLVSKFPRKKQLIAIPAAITPRPGYMPMFVSEHNGCSSLLPMNDNVRRFAHVEKKRAPKKGPRIQLRTVEFCASMRERIVVPTLPLHEILRRVPAAVEISLIITDAQGFDTSVIATVGKQNAAKVPFIAVECQDLPVPNQLFLVSNALSCAEQQYCMEKHLPVRLSYCWDNAPKVRELNCLYESTLRHTVVVPTHFKITGGQKNISYTRRAATAFQCPEFVP